jgi:hypothetical protein
VAGCVKLPDHYPSLSWADLEIIAYVDSRYVSISKVKLDIAYGIELMERQHGGQWSCQ